MLFCQDFRWRHQRGLITILTGGNHCHHGNDRLSGTDISLEQAIHAPDRRHVSLYFRYNPLLGGRKGKGKRATKSLPYLPTCFERNTLFDDPAAFS